MTSGIPDSSGPGQAALSRAEQDIQNVLAAAGLRRQHPGWAIAWSASSRHFVAARLFRGADVLHLTARSISELSALLDQAEQDVT
jgi:hypothetical protein